MAKKHQQSKTNQNTLSKKYKYLQSAVAGGLLLVAITVIFAWNQSAEDSDLSVIGKGQNVVVQVHDPG